jgi:nucleotide-binding universal stress UspA family protein
MKRFKNILAVANGDADASRELLAGATDLARRNGAQLTLLAVVEPMMRRRRLGGIRPESALELESLIAESRREELGELSADAGLPVSVDVAVGIGFVEIIRRVLTADHDLVMTTADSPRQSRGLGGAPSAMHLLRKSPVPVWVHRRGSDRRRDVAVAVGPFDDDEAHDPMHTVLLELASSLAARRDGELHVIHAWRFPGETMLRRGRTKTSPEQVDAFVAEAHRQAEADLAHLLDTVTMPDVPIDVHLHKGSAGDVIPALVDQHRPGVLVMGTLARTGIPGVIIGNTAERVLGTVDASILAAKPPGFTSPVSL